MAIKDPTMDIEYELDLTTEKHSGKINKKQYIMIHHTASDPKSSFENVTKYIANYRHPDGETRDISAHYTVGKEGQYGRIGTDDYYLWHAGTGNGIAAIPENQGNLYCIGIEVVSDGDQFTSQQILALGKLVRELQKKHDITDCMVIRHKDYAPGRKIDIGDNFYKVLGYKSFFQWKDQELKNTVAGDGFTPPTEYSDTHIPSHIEYQIESLSKEEFKTLMVYILAKI